MSNEYYTKSGAPATGATGSSAPMRAQFSDIEAGFDKLPTLSGNGSKAVVINAGGSALSVTAAALALAVALTTAGSGDITLRSSGATDITLPTTGTLATLSNKLSDFAATTSAELKSVISDETGSGALVFANTPTLVTPVLGVATATSINKLAITAPATGSTLTIADGKTLTASNTITFTATDGSTLAIGAGGTVAYTANKLSVFAATSSAELASVLSDETGSGKCMLNDSPAVKGTWTVESGTWTLPALTLGGTVSGGGNQINNVSIGTSNPLAGTFTTLTATGLLDLSGSSAGQIKFPSTQNASANANTLDDYDEYTGASAACTGAITTSAGWKLTKVGNLVTLTVGAASGTASVSTGYTYGTAIPAKYRPAVGVTIAVPMKNNGAYQSTPGAIYVSNTGNITCYRLPDFASNFTAGANAGTDYDVTISWTV